MSDPDSLVVADTSTVISDYWCLDRPRLGAELVPDFLNSEVTNG